MNERRSRHLGSTGLRRTLENASPATKALVDILTGDTAGPEQAVDCLRAEREREPGAPEGAMGAIERMIEGFQTSDETLCDYLASSEIWRVPPGKRPPEIQQAIDRSKVAQQFIRALEQVQADPELHAKLTALERTYRRSGQYLLAFEEGRWRLVRPGAPPERQALKPGAKNTPLRDGWTLTRVDAVEGRGRRAARVSLGHELGATQMRARLDVRLWNLVKGRFVEFGLHLEGPARLFGARATLGNASGPLTEPCELLSGNGGVRFPRLPFESMPVWLEMEWWQENSRTALRERYSVPIVT